MVAGERPKLIEEIKYPQQLISLVSSCWAQDPDTRPTAQEALETLEGIDLVEDEETSFS